MSNLPHSLKWETLRHEIKAELSYAGNVTVEDLAYRLREWADQIEKKGKYSPWFEKEFN